MEWRAASRFPGEPGCGMAPAFSHSVLKVSVCRPAPAVVRRCDFAEKFYAKPFTGQPNYFRSSAPTAWCSRFAPPARRIGTETESLSSRPRMQCQYEHPKFGRPTKGPDGVGRTLLSTAFDSDLIYVLPRLSSRDHGTAAALGGPILARSLRDSLLLQLLVGLVGAGDCPFLDS